jgi:hypothetical protein
MVLTIGGAAITIAGLVGAFKSAQHEVRRAGERIDIGKQLAVEEQEAINALSIRAPNNTAQVHSDFEKRYAEHDIVRPSRSETPYLAAHETKRLAGLLLESTRSNLIWAGVGLVLSTLASCLALVLL